MKPTERVLRMPTQGSTLVKPVGMAGPVRNRTSNIEHQTGLSELRPYRFRAGS
jgi:hypothetical protein